MKRLILATLPLTLALTASAAQAATLQLRSADSTISTKTVDSIENATGTVWDARPF